MRYSVVLIALFYSFIAHSQPNTDIFIFNLKIENSSLSFVDGKNISNNDGYDNQPSFINDNQYLFASTRNGQTDIALFNEKYETKSWLNFTEGGEYTPLKIPNQRMVSAVRLDPDGKQRLYQYNMSNGESSELIKDLVVAYYTWYNENIIVSAVIEDEGLNLYTTNLSEGWNRKYDTNVGRSFHKIPNSNLVSYISKTEDNWTINSLNPLTGEVNVITKTLEGVEDMCWLNNGSILMGKDAKIYMLNPSKESDWKEIASLEAYGIKSITRIASNAISSKLLLAAEIDGASTNNQSENPTQEGANQESVEGIVQKQLDAYNSRDIDAFMATYSNDIKLYNYPNELRTEGKEAMRKSYQSWFDSATDLNAKVEKRIVIGNKVIDEENVTARGQQFHAVAIYEVENGLITKVTFIQ
ncbi:MAG: nuclear transport factor 2 family protein [bacterium]